MLTTDTWTWKICNLPLKQSTTKGPNILSLKPKVALLHPQINGPEPTMLLSIESAKSYQYSDEVAWKWHKSWKLPVMKVNLDLIDPTNQEKLVLPNDIYAQIFAVKATLDENQQPILTDVGLKGVTKLELTDGTCTFETLKFQSTSYNSDGVKFHLVICLYLLVSEDIPPKMLKAIISPGIFVDSRKSCKDNVNLGDTKLRVYMDPFSPDSFTKCFVKRNNRKRDTTEQDILDSVEGLTSYLTAPNIRNKVKHPIFLGVRFPSCVSLYYNSHAVAQHMRPNLPEFLQELLERDYEASSFGSPKDLPPENSFFIMSVDLRNIQDKSSRKKVSEILNPIRYESLSVVFSHSEVPNHFVRLTDLDSLMELYSKSYTKFLQRAKTTQQDEDSNDPEEDGPSEPLIPPEKQTIDLRATKAARPKDWLSYFRMSPLVAENIPNSSLSIEDHYQQPVKKLKTEANVSPPSSTRSKASSSETRSVAHADRKTSSSLRFDHGHGSNGQDKKQLLLMSLVDQGNQMLAQKLSQQRASNTNSFENTSNQRSNESRFNGQLFSGPSGLTNYNGMLSEQQSANKINMSNGMLNNLVLWNQNPLLLQQLTQAAQQQHLLRSLNNVNMGQINNNNGLDLSKLLGLNMDFQSVQNQ